MEITEDKGREGISGEREKAVLVSVRWGESDQATAGESLLELHSLAETAGAEVVAELLQARARPDAATFVGKGKLEELASLVSAHAADLVVFDQELTPSQQRNLESELRAKVLDRTALILDIFALHAHSKEGKAQVEMAQLRYRLTHLTGKGIELSRLGGGIGTRGPGETKLEVDRRRIKTRIRTLDRELKDLSRVRRVKRKRRERQAVSTYALVGYTNAGKSSLLNYLTGAGVTVEDQLFSTLDPITRRVELSTGRRAVITDTVGFIDNLPHQLIEAFKSTLEEVGEADVLVHVIDASSPNVKRKIRAVDVVLEEVGAGDMPTIYVFNKSDLLAQEDTRRLQKDFPQAVFTSAVNGEGIAVLLERMSSMQGSSRVVRVSIPHGQGELLALIHRKGRVLAMESDESGHHIVADIPLESLHRIEPYIEERSSEK